MKILAIVSTVMFICLFGMLIILGLGYDPCSDGKKLMQIGRFVVVCK